MIVYFKEPSPCTSGYEPIIGLGELVKRRKEESKIGFNFFDNIYTTPKYIKNAFDKILEFSGIREIGKWEEAKLKEATKKGYVYFIQNGDISQIKIGWAKDPHTRLKELQTGNPNTLHLVAIMPAPDRSLELFLHKEFNKHHLKGEWFRYEGKLKTFLKTNDNVFLIETS